MFSLPAEVQLDIFKFLSCEKLYSIKQIHLYFYDFINNFEGELAREKFYGISIDVDRFKRGPNSKFIKHEAKNFNFPLNEQLEEKWRNRLETQIPLYLVPRNASNIVICLSKVINTEYYLQLPNFIKNKKDLKIVFYFLNKLFNCSFGYAEFYKVIFNPELIELLFGRISKQFYIYNCNLSITKHNIENLSQFVLNNLSNGILKIAFSVENFIMENYKNNLFKILTNGRDNFEVVELKFYNSLGNLDPNMNVTLFYDQIIEYIATSKECSKIVPVICFDFSNYKNLEICGRAKEVKIGQ
uniref:F-box domain-containing protein n=1 Tax=Meloidogyne enterolobii TaxID=390850 RepID=A0A6V7VVA6_MELEN|nr:unnamed protein product [Meloidogyne enterolobii]